MIFFFGESLDLSILRPDGSKAVVSFDSDISDEKSLRALYTLFAKGDSLELDVATNEDFSGRQKYIGIEARLIPNYK